MAARATIVTLGLGAVFIAAFAASQISRPQATAVGWTEVASGSTIRDADGTRAAEVRDLRAQLEEIRSLLPGAGSMALAELTVPQRAELCGQNVPLERPRVREGLAYELILSAGRPLMPMLWMRRAPAVLPMIERKLSAASLPDDLKYLAMIESDLRETARSPAGAAGLWQFVRGTGRRYGLRIDRYLDERLDSLASTDAAIAYLSDLHEEFGDWFLAMAAYNAGENKVRAALDASPSASFFELYLPYETRRYVYRILAAKLITANPTSYGLVRMTAYDQPNYRIVEVEVRRARADLKKLATEHGLDYSALRLANPQIRSSSLPRGRHRLRILKHSPRSESH